jgi:hypothetical protein
VEQIRNKSDGELRALPDSGADPGSRKWETVKLEIELRNSERQLEASQTLARFTKRLVLATWVLGVATLVLAVASAIQVYLLVKK